MAFNQVENLILADAIGNLEDQLKSLGENIPEALYLGYAMTFVLTNDKKLTVQDRSTLEPREDIIPVDCYNFYRPMNTATAVQEYIEWGKESPEKFYI